VSSLNSGATSAKAGMHRGRNICRQGAREEELSHRRRRRPTGIFGEDGLIQRSPVSPPAGGYFDPGIFELLQHRPLMAKSCVITVACDQWRSRAPNASAKEGKGGNSICNETKTLFHLEPFGEPSDQNLTGGLPHALICPGAWGALNRRHPLSAW
jgi:hypothetical protein